MVVVKSRQFCGNVWGSFNCCNYDLVDMIYREVFKKFAYGNCTGVDKKNRLLMMMMTLVVTDNDDDDDGDDDDDVYGYR